MGQSKSQGLREGEFRKRKKTKKKTEQRLLIHM